MTGQRHPPSVLLRKASQRWYWIPSAVLALGLASLALLLATSSLSEHFIVRDSDRVRVLGEIQENVSVSHLWLEEHVSGDPNVPLDEIDQRLWDSRRLSRALLAEDGSLPHGFEVRPLEEPAMRELAERLRDAVDHFTTLSGIRRAGYALGRLEEVETGSPMDVEYDRVFIALMGDAREIERRIVDRLAENRRRSRLLYRSILFAWVAIVALAVSGLWTLERRRKEAVEALRDSEERLLHAQKMEAVGRLAGGLAHDVNNYLAAINAQCELIKRKLGDDQALVAKMDGLIASSFKVSSLIKRLLAFSRQEAVRPEVVQVNRLVAELETMLSRLIGEDVDFEPSLGDGLWNIEADPAQIEQLLVNLVVNARDAMPTGGRLTMATANQHIGEAEAELHPGLVPGEYVVLSVSDTGTGIPPEIRDKIFEPFFTTKGRSGSSGLGLATVYGVVRQNGGTVTVYSELNVGTTFKVYLRRSEVEVARVPAGGVTDTGPVEGGSERILLAEDNDELRTSLKEALGAFGYRVTAAADGEVAFATFEALPGQFDLVVTDVVMPGMSGRELSDRIRAEHPGTRVIFISGYTSDVILRHGVSEGQVDFLEKPFTEERLARKVREVLDRQPAGAPARE